MTSPRITRHKAVVTHSTIVNDDEENNFVPTVTLTEKNTPSISNIASAGDGEEEDTDDEETEIAETSPDYPSSSRGYEGDDEGRDPDDIEEARGRSFIQPNGDEDDEITVLERDDSFSVQKLREKYCLTLDQMGRGTLFATRVTVWIVRDSIRVVAPAYALNNFVPSISDSQGWIIGAMPQINDTIGQGLGSLVNKKNPMSALKALGNNDMKMGAVIKASVQATNLGIGCLAGWGVYNYFGPNPNVAALATMMTSYLAKIVVEPFTLQMWKLFVPSREEINNFNVNLLQAYGQYAFNVFNSICLTEMGTSLLQVMFPPSETFGPVEHDVYREEMIKTIMFCLSYGAHELGKSYMDGQRQRPLLPKPSEVQAKTPGDIEAREEPVESAIDTEDMAEAIQMEEEASLDVVVQQPPTSMVQGLNGIGGRAANIFLYVGYCGIGYLGVVANCYYGEECTEMFGDEMTNYAIMAAPFVADVTLRNTDRLLSAGKSLVSLAGQSVSLASACCSYFGSRARRAEGMRRLEESEILLMQDSPRIKRK